MSIHKRSASSVWNGPGPTGAGKVSVQSGVFSDISYTAKQRFESEPGTNPEELIAAAHAACFGMALAFNLSGAGLEAEELKTTATITLDKSSGNWTLTGSHLDVRGKLKSGDAAAFQKAAEDAKAGCPISRALNMPVTMTATLE
jgi:lipoyl-dependent peroxiredoxin